MLGKSAYQGRKNLFSLLLIESIDQTHKIALLADKVDWTGLEQDFSVYYFKTGQPVVCSFYSRTEQLFFSENCLNT